MKRSILVLSLFSLGPGCDGCGTGTAASLGDAGSGGAQASGADSTSGGADSLPTHGDTSASTTSTEAGSSATSSDGSSAGFALPDLPPFPEACWDPAPTILVERAQGPEGPLAFESVYLVTDWCSGAPGAILQTTQGDMLRCLVEGPRPLSGVVACGFGSSDIPQFTAELLEPYDDPDPDHASAGVHLHARIVALGEGWDVSVEIDVPDCGDRDCFCPCE